MFPPGLEPGTFRVLGERDNRYTTETCGGMRYNAFIYCLYKCICFVCHMLTKHCLVYSSRSICHGYSLLY